MRPIYRFGLTEKHIEQLANGESVEFIIPCMTTPGHNDTVVIEPFQDENMNRYTNPTYSEMDGTR